jgi:hypothetical protein
MQEGKEKVNTSAGKKVKNVELITRKIAKIKQDTRKCKWT